MAAKAQNKSIFDVHPAVAMAQSVIAGMKEKTGRSLEEWVELVGSAGPATEKERRDWLKAKQGLGTNYAGFVAEVSVGKGEGYSPEGYLRLAGQYVEKMFDGPKAGLRPIYDALLAAGLKLGKDVRVSPCQTFVPLYRNHVFAQIKPTTRTRIDFGLALKDTKTPKRLIDTGGFAKKDRITRRIEISSVEEIDDEVRRWMKTAYDMDS
jgi:hypothetical protein